MTSPRYLPKKNRSLSKDLHIHSGRNCTQDSSKVKKPRMSVYVTAVWMNRLWLSIHSNKKEGTILIHAACMSIKISYVKEIKTKDYMLSDTICMKF